VRRKKLVLTPPARWRLAPALRLAAGAGRLAPSAWRPQRRRAGSGFSEAHAAAERWRRR